jgi:enoyl-CoA hydratase/carnithine racemase
MSLPATMVAKEAVNRAFETSLAEGVRFERRTFHATFAFDDRAEGMNAFADKRKPAGNIARSTTCAGVDRPAVAPYKRALP